MAKPGSCISGSANQALVNMVRLDIFNRDAHPQLITLTLAACVLGKNIGTIWAWYYGEADMPQEAADALQKWKAEGMRAGEFWLMPNEHGSFGKRGDWLAFRRVMDAPYPLRYHEAAAILGINQWEVYNWYWNLRPVPQAAINNVAAFHAKYPRNRFPRQEALAYAAPAFKDYEPVRKERVPRK